MSTPGFFTLTFDETYSPITQKDSRPISSRWARFKNRLMRRPATYGHDLDEHGYPATLFVLETTSDASSATQGRPEE